MYCIALLVEAFVFRALYTREFARVLVDSLNLVFCGKLSLSCKGSSEIVQFEVQIWQNPLGCPWICQIWCFVQSRELIGLKSEFNRRINPRKLFRRTRSALRGFFEDRSLCRVRVF